MKRILVAGGAGYLGSIIIPALLARGHRIEVIDLLWFGDHLPPNVLVRQQDCWSLTVEDLRSFDTVIFLAGLSNDPMADYDPAGNYRENAALPAYLSFIARQAGVKRFIHGGSASVYGFSPTHDQIETDAPKAAYPYGVSKLQAETGIMQQVSPTFSVISFRQGTVAGYSPRMRFDLVINQMVRDATTKGVISVSNPTIWRPILAIEDAARAYVKAVEAPQRVSGVFNIASFNMTLLAIAVVIAEWFKKHRKTAIKLAIGKDASPRSYRTGIEKAREQLHFEPKVDIAKIVRTIVEHEAGYGDYSNPAFYNIETFRSLRTGPKPSGSMIEIDKLRSC